MSSVSKVLEAGLCSGCGACAFADPEAFKMQPTDEGTIVACALEDSVEKPDTRKLCPFTGEGRNEDEIAEDLWPNLPRDQHIGSYLKPIACNITDAGQREHSSSGGLGTWLAMQLLKTGKVDGVVHVKENVSQTSSNDTPLFSYAISKTCEEIQNGAKTRYYPVTLSGVLELLAHSNGRYAIVAIPCFAKALRQLVHENKIAPDKIGFIIGLVCGHMKSRYFAEYLAWQKGVTPGSLKGFNFRAKLSGHSASDYGFRMITDDRDETYPMNTVKGRDWGEGLFKLRACEFCDDVLAECADIAIGDAWLPDYVNNPLGTNIAVVRNDELAALISEGKASGQLKVDDLTPADISKSQSSGLRHRREGLAHRLAVGTRNSTFVPEKRVKPKVATGNRKAIYNLRLEIAETSNAAFNLARTTQNLNLFEKKTRRVRYRLKNATHGSLSRRILSKLRRETQKIIKKFSHG
jgi:coenzyme F420-reducing hydrogenase beta subunit